MEKNVAKLPVSPNCLLDDTLRERLNLAWQSVIDDFNDRKKAEDKSRKLTIDIEFKPDAETNNIDITTKINTKLAPYISVKPSYLGNLNQLKLFE